MAMTLERGGPSITMDSIRFGEGQRWMEQWGERRAGRYYTSWKPIRGPQPTLTAKTAQKPRVNSTRKVTPRGRTYVLSGRIVCGRRPHTCTLPLLR